MTILLGSTSAGVASVDNIANGQWIGSLFPALASGTVDTISVFSDTNSPADTCNMAIFSDAGSGVPGSRIGNVVTATIPSSGPVVITSGSGANAAVVLGTSYWVVFTSSTGFFNYQLFDAVANARSFTASAQSLTMTPWSGNLGQAPGTLDVHADGTVSGGGTLSISEIN